MATANLTWQASPGNTSYVVEYKKTADSSWTTASGSPTSALLLNISGIQEGISYDYRVTSQCGVAIGSAIIKTETAPVTLQWIEDTYTCEQDVPFGLARTVSGMASPQKVFWDATTSRYYVVDVDDPNGNIYWFTPDTMFNYSDRTVAPGIAFNYLGTSLHDPSKRKIWAAGHVTNGAIVYDIASNTASTITYGTNCDYCRTNMKLFGNTVYANGAAVTNGVSNMYLIDTNTSVVTPILNSSIPSGSIYFAQAFNIFNIGSNIWCCSAQRGNGNIAIYNSTLSNSPTIITLTGLPGGGVQTWSGSNYWQSQFYDEEKNKFYLHDSGSNRWLIIDTLTNTVIQNTLLVNRGGKSNSSFNFVRNELNGDLYLSGQFVNNLSDTTPIKRTYKINRDTGDYEYILTDVLFSSLTLRPGTNEMWGADQGLLYPTAGYDTDGFLHKYLG